MKIKKTRYIIVAVILMALMMLSGCRSSSSEVVYSPIYGFKFPSWDFLIWPMAALIYGLGKTAAFGQYGIAIALSTIIVRTCAWPIYAKTNDMSLKMQLMGPEQAKLEAKYAGKTDQESMQRKQMETMQLYKKYGVGFGGCLMPLLQLPIFVSFFETLRRIPSTTASYLAENPDLGIEKLPLDFEFFNTTFLGIDLFKDRSAGGTQEIGIWVLGVLVAVTQLVSQILLTRRQKKQKEQSMSNVPQYRRPTPTDQQKQTDMMMKIMMYGMPVMMLVFIIGSPAALGLYWLVGNIYSTIQSYIGSVRSAKRMEKLRTKMNGTTGGFYEK